MFSGGSFVANGIFQILIKGETQMFGKDKAKSPIDKLYDDFNALTDEDKAK